MGLRGQYLDLGRQDERRIEPGAQRFDLAPGTVDSRLGPAMTGHQLDLALSAGRHAIERAKLAGADLIWADGQGLGAALTNAAWERWLRRSETTAASILDLGLEWGADLRRRGQPPVPVPVPVPALSASGAALGCCALDCAAARASDCAGAILHRHGDALADPYEMLRRIGGFEHAALVGSALAAAQLGLRWVALGESARVARRLAVRLNRTVALWLEPARAERVLALQ